MPIEGRAAVLRPAKIVQQRELFRIGVVEMRHALHLCSCFGRRGDQEKWLSSPVTRLLFKPNASAMMRAEKCAQCETIDGRIGARLPG